MNGKTKDIFMLSKLPSPVYPMLDVVSHTQQPFFPDSLFLMLLVSELELVSILAPSSLILLRNAGKLLSTGYTKG